MSATVKSGPYERVARFFEGSRRMLELVYVPLLTLGLLVFIFLLSYLIFKIIPLNNGEDFTFLFLTWELHAEPESKLLLLIMLSGALGSFVHAAHSFVVYVGLGEFKLSWVWWYMMRPFIGMALAIIFYFVVMAGFISIESVVPVTTPMTVNQGTQYVENEQQSEVVPITSNNPGMSEVHDAKRKVYILLALSALVGMFSAKAIDKLGDIFNTLFQSQSSETRYQKDSYKRAFDKAQDPLYDQDALG